MATTAVEVVSPTKLLFEGEAEMVVTRSVDGDIAFLAEHVPLLAALDPCVTRIVAPDGSEVRIAIAGGFVEVRDSKVTILADAAELSGDIDVEQARRDLQAATEDQNEPVERQHFSMQRWAEVRIEAAMAAAGPVLTGER
jgi:F-type H+-transporting ATPase subunit epsilon